ncbi:hypothetical protein [Paenibacillus sp. y28]|uniref:hypothetical protein n=1 Tax=Paenibacillus sp. y28 TaxID=3129110 RepID=UPI003015BB2A
MSNIPFYTELFHETGVNDTTYKIISRSILDDHSLTEVQKIEQLRQMDEAFHAAVLDTDETLS